MHPIGVHRSSSPPPFGCEWVAPGPHASSILKHAVAESAHGVDPVSRARTDVLRDGEGRVGSGLRMRAVMRGRGEFGTMR